MSDTTLNLGNFQFARYEIPEEIPFGGAQALTVHKLVGGKRIIDAMGFDPAPVEWRGFFVGSAALDRALYVDGLRKAGKPLVLTWSQLRYTVVISQFNCRFVRGYRIPYRITCEPVSDDTAPVTSITSPSPEQLISDDMASAGSLSDGIGDATLSGQMRTLNSAISGVGSLATAAQSQINTVLVPLAAVRSRVAILLQAATATIGNVSTVGGVAPSNPIAQQVVGLTDQISAMQQTPQLVNLDRTLARVQTNIGALSSGTKSVTTAGGNLYSLASQQYGDPMGWTAIAAANALTDPELAGVNALNIPPFSNDTNGVLNG